MVSYQGVDHTLEAYKIKSALPFKIFSTLLVLPDFQANLRPCYWLVLPAAGDRPAGSSGAKSEFTALIRLDAGLQMIQEETLPMVMFFIRFKEQLKNHRV